VDRLSRKIVGQAGALELIIPYIKTYEAGLNSPDRPAGIFLLLGPTGTGKTRTVEAIAETLHGSAKHLLKIDCAEYQSDHEVAKLIGAPPGYVGHRETKALLTQERLQSVVSSTCDLALVLFDEIEKAAPSLTTLLLGALDKATLNLGDNSVVNFENTLIFLTSNLGAREMLHQVRPEIGFQSPGHRPVSELVAKLESIAMSSVRKRFSPEFVNRIDAIITYRPLDAAALSAILDHHIAELQRHVHTRLGERSFDISVSPAARELLLEKGFNQEYGARELKRTIHRMLTQPLAALVAEGQVAAGSRVVADLADSGDALTLRSEAQPALATGDMALRTVLVLDDNSQLLAWLQRELELTGMTVLAAGTAAEAQHLAITQPLDLAIVDLLLPDGDGLSVAFELLRLWPKLRVVVMTGGELSADEIAICERHDFPLLRKPFLARDIISLARASLLRSSAAPTTQDS
jgi:ATP-dependent Clp protease ATP-binding subunit ClpA/ActR/RegA family two-component response regulator